MMYKTMIFHFFPLIFSLCYNDDCCLSYFAFPVDALLDFLSSSLSDLTHRVHAFDFEMRFVVQISLDREGPLKFTLNLELN